MRYDEVSYKIFRVGDNPEVLSYECNTCYDNGENKQNDMIKFVTTF